VHNSATTRPWPEVVDAVTLTLTEDYGNPSSLHRKGMQAERHLRRARSALAELLGVDQDTIIFTSGATESNNLALRGAARVLERWGHHIITTSIEHSSVLETCRGLQHAGFEVLELPVDEYGVVSAEELAGAIRDDTIIVSMMFVNNEVGALQPVPQVGRIIRRRRGKGQHICFHVDAVQALGKVTLRPREQSIDLMSLSAHKFHGPKGVGALYRSRGIRLEPLTTGGDHEQGLRPGTENVPGIAGLGEAVRKLDDWPQSARELRKLRNHLVRRVLDEIPGARFNGSVDPNVSAPHIANFSFSGTRAEVLVHYLEAEGIYVSTGSACHSRVSDPSHVLQAMGLTASELQGAIRVSVSSQNSIEDVDYLVDKLAVVVPELRRIGRR